MATIQPTITVLNRELDGNQNGAAILVSWLAVTENDVAAPVQYVALPDRSVQFEGTFGGATCKLVGSNDGSNYRELTDPQGNDISKTTTGDLEAVTEITRYTKPLYSGGTLQSMNCYLLCAGARRG